MAERKSSKALMPKPAGQPRLPRITGTAAHITIMLAHMKRNDGPHPTESNIPLLGKMETE
jgi:hypothetical protein